MSRIELIVALVAASALLAGLARAIDVHYAIMLVLGGLALGFVPGLAAPRIAPDVVLFVFLPPLIYAAGYGVSAQDLREHALAIGLLAVGLVLATMCGVAVVAHLVAGIPWGPAMVLGAVLGATDPVAASAVLQRLGAPRRIATILQGEALINDGTGLTAYALAVSAVVGGSFSLAAGVGHFAAVAAGGVAIGLAVGWLSNRLRRLIDDPAIEISISLLTAYLAYIPADRLGVSGVLAAVSAGVYASHRATVGISASSRLQMLGFWGVLTFLLEAVLFLLIGLQLRGIVSDLHGGIAMPLAYAAAVFAAVMAIRLAWMFVVPALVRIVGPRDVHGSGRRELVVLGWSGMRGGVSLAAALAIPLTAAAGVPFPDRELLIFISYVTIAATIIVPGLTLEPLMRRLGVGEGDAAARAEARARVRMAHAALEHIDDVADEERLPDRVVDPLRTAYELRIQRLEPHADGGRTAENGGAKLARRSRSLRREVIEVERRLLAELRRSGEISLAAQRRIERDLDLEESRLGEQLT